MERMVIRRHILGRIIGSTADAEAAATPSPPDICAQTCPSRAILELIADKWALLVLHASLSAALLLAVACSAAGLVMLLRAERR